MLLLQNKIRSIALRTTANISALIRVSTNTRAWATIPFLPSLNLRNPVLIQYLACTRGPTFVQACMVLISFAEMTRQYFGGLDVGIGDTSLEVGVYNSVSVALYHSVLQDFFHNPPTYKTRVQLSWGAKVSSFSDSVHISIIISLICPLLQI